MIEQQRSPSHNREDIVNVVKKMTGVDAYQKLAKSGRAPVFFNKNIDNVFVGVSHFVNPLSASAREKNDTSKQVLLRGLIDINVNAGLMVILSLLNPYAAVVGKIIYNLGATLFDRKREKDNNKTAFLARDSS